LSTSKKTNDFFSKNSTCPTCNQTIDEAFRQHKLDEAKKNIDKLSNGIIDITAKICSDGKILEENSKLRKAIDEQKQSIKSLNRLLSHVKEEKQQLVLEISKPEDIVVVDDTEKALLEVEKSKILAERSRLISERNMLSFVSTMLRDNGVKSRMVESYIPFINERINHYLEIFDLFVSFEFDKDFNETIKARHFDEYSYESFSQGEKSRIDLALMITWRDVAKIRGSVNPNIIILDEVFDGSLNSDGVESLKAILNDDSANNIVITHKKETQDSAFDRRFRVQKSGNFTEILEESV
jgi:hypothetical protein